ncbi:MAG: aspartate aminotransferase family protein, partial [Gemmatimonadetes bacterium]|nr:aspartate aminotransferase family protein [Gemmatimonadota bacterium]
MKELPKREVPGPKSAELLEISRKYEPPCMADQVPVVWDHGEGVHVWDVDGNEYIDFTSGVLVTNLGHSHPHHVAAIQEQAGRLMNCYSFPTPERVTLSQRLTDLLPENLDKIFLLTTGAEATEAALRIAKRYTGKHEVLSFYGGFHGRTYGPMSVAGSMKTKRQFGPQLPGGILAPFPYFYRDFYKSETEEECGDRCIEALDRIVESTSSGDLGAVMTEPYQGGAGFIFPPDGWLKKLEKWARDRGLLFILDEVQSSFGRTGKLFALEWDDLQPHMVCLGKGIGSGMPASALAGESDIFDCMGVGEMSSTCGGNPMASAASHAVLDVMEREKLADNALQVGAYMMDRFREMQKKYPKLGDIRGRGLVMGLEFVEDRESRTPDADMTLQVMLSAAR